MSSYRRRQERKDWRAEKKAILFNLRSVLPKLEIVDKGDAYQASRMVRGIVQQLQADIGELHREIYKLKRIAGDAEFERQMVRGRHGFRFNPRMDYIMPSMSDIQTIDMEQLAFMEHIDHRVLKGYETDIERETIDKCRRQVMHLLVERGWLKPVIRKMRHVTTYSIGLWVGKAVPVAPPREL